MNTQPRALPLEPLDLPLRRQEDGGYRVGSGRVSLESVLQAFGEGDCPEAIVLRYPTLDLGETYTTLAAYVNARAPFDTYLDERLRLAELLRAENEQRDPLPAALRNRLRTETLVSRG